LSRRSEGGSPSTNPFAAWTEVAVTDGDDVVGACELAAAAPRASNLDVSH